MDREVKMTWARNVLLTMLCIALSFIVTAETVNAEIVCNVTCPSFSFTDTNGNVVTNQTIRGKATILMFSQSSCYNTVRTINSIGRSDWFPIENVNFVFGLFNGTADTTKEFQSTYSYDGMTFCYTDNSNTMTQAAFSCYYQAGGEEESVSTPLLFILDQSGNIRYVSEGYISCDDVAAVLDDYTSLDYLIEDENIDVFVDSQNEMVYTGYAFEPLVYVTKGGDNLYLTEDKHYTVTYENNINAGTAYALVTGLGYMKGSKRLEFQIQPRNLSNASVMSIAEQLYTGNGITPQIQVFCSGKMLVQGKDFSVAFSNNVNPGTAHVQITGIGNYTGTKSAFFTIKEPKVTAFTVNDQQYKVTNGSTNQVSYVGITDKTKKTITIPEYVNYKGIKYSVTSVASKSFKGNKKLTSIKIASGITTIGTSAFEGCTNLKSITLGKSIKKIGKNAFKNCKKLNKITIKSTKLKSVGKGALKGVNAKCKIKVPSKKLKAYKKLFKGKGQKKSVKVY